ncbi:dicarboxylate/amino acid:cation symporter [Melioribacter sp. OK-6-Me]|uniref:dicarboxylate/amino acid:cation symporter n=1 Tax=unclassified Melioribacter TaxID=2627329 RepID=UPI003ED93830
MKFLKSLTFWIFIGFAFGILFGYIFKESILPLANPMATIFINTLKMIVMPIIIFSIASGILNIESGKELKRLGIKTFSYYLITTALAILTGQILVLLVKPGSNITNLVSAEVDNIPATEGSIIDILINIIPTNPFKAMAEGNVIQVIFFMILFALVIMQFEDKYRTFFNDFFQGGFNVMMEMVRWIVWLAPIGVFGIVAGIVAETGFDAIIGLMKYFFTVLSGLLIHSIITLPLILSLFGNMNPWLHFKNMLLAIETAFFTSSSMATLPITMDCVINNDKVEPKVANFVLPIGATVNMDGTALYEAVAVIFIAQAYGIELTFVQLAIVLVTTILASIGAAAIPMAGFVMITVILKAVGLPLEGVGLVLAVDRLLDMVRTTVNVWSDSCGAVVVNNLSRKEILVRSDS